jgi:hypothetical protein
LFDRGGEEMKNKELRVKLSRLESKIHNLHFAIGDLIRELDTEKGEGERK